MEFYKLEGGEKHGHRLEMGDHRDYTIIILGIIFGLLGSWGSYVGYFLATAIVGYMVAGGYMNGAIHGALVGIVSGIVVGILAVIGLAALAGAGAAAVGALIIIVGIIVSAIIGAIGGAVGALIKGEA